MRTLVAICSALLSTTAATAQETSVALDQLPRAITFAVRTWFPQAMPRSAAQETEEGKTVFEVTLTERGRNIDVTLTPEGTIVLVEREIAHRELPVPVARAVRARYRDATFRFVEAVFTISGQKEVLAYYELKLAMAAGKVLELEVAPDGKILKEEEDVENEPGSLSAVPENASDVLTAAQVAAATGLDVAQPARARAVLAHR